MPARYQCLDCKKEWGLLTPNSHACPHCGHVYVKWLNYDEWHKDWHKREPDMKDF